MFSSWHHGQRKIQVYRVDPAPEEQVRLWLLLDCALPGGEDAGGGGKDGRDAAPGQPAGGAQHPAQVPASHRQHQAAGRLQTDGGVSRAGHPAGLLSHPDNSGRGLRQVRQRADRVARGRVPRGFHKRSPTCQTWKGELSRS